MRESAERRFKRCRPNCVAKAAIVCTVPLQEPRTEGRDVLRAATAERTWQTESRGGAAAATHAATTAISSLVGAGAGLRFPAGTARRAPAARSTAPAGRAPAATFGGRAGACVWTAGDAKSDAAHIGFAPGVAPGSTSMIARDAACAMAATADTARKSGSTTS